MRERLAQAWCSPIGQRLAQYELNRALDIASDRVVVSEFAQHMSARIAEAALFWVSDEMGALLQTAAASLPSTVLQPTDLVVPQGFVVFHNPLIGIDATFGNDPVRIFAMAWHLGKLQDSHCVAMHFYGLVTEGIPELRGKSAQYGSELFILGRSAWVFGTAQEDFEEPIFHDMNEVNRRSRIEDRRLLHAFNLLISQRVAVVSDLPHDRIQRRQAARRGHSPDPVKIVELRRPATRPTDDVACPHPVDWSHRWVVGAHWRRVWHASQNRHVPHLILPYIKGPTDKPLVLKETVYKWDR